MKVAQEQTEELRRHDYVSRVNLAFRECFENNITRAFELLDGCPEDLRGWEWDYVRRQCRLDFWTARDSCPSVNVVAFSPDSKRVASGSGGYYRRGTPGDLVVRDAATGKELFSRRNLPGGVNCLAFSPDGTLLATGHGTVLTIWDAATGRMIRQMDAGDSVGLLSLAFHPDGRRVIAGYGHFNGGGIRGHARLWDIATGSPMGDPFPDLTDGVWSVAFSPDGREAALTGSGVVEIWDVRGTPKKVRELRGAGGLHLCCRLQFRWPLDRLGRATTVRSVSGTAPRALWCVP